MKVVGENHLFKKLPQKSTIRATNNKFNILLFMPIYLCYCNTLSTQFHVEFSVPDPSALPLLMSDSELTKLNLLY